MNEQITEAYLEQIDLLVVALDDDERVIGANKALCETLRIPREKILTSNWFEHFVPQTFRRAVRETYAQLMQGDLETVVFYENPLLLGDGQELMVSWHNTLLRNDSGEAVGTLSFGETHFSRSDVEEQLGQSRRLLDQTRHALDVNTRKFDRSRIILRDTQKTLDDYRAAIDRSAIVARTDAQGVITYVNDLFCEISEYSREELLGQDHRIVNSGHHSKAFMTELWQTISSGRLWQGEICNRSKSGRQYWVYTTIVPFLEKGKPYQYMAIRHDITAKKEAEERLLQQATLARLGEMAAVVAHEIKNPLAGISGAIQVIGERLPEESRDRSVMHGIVERIDDLNATLEDLLTYARPHPLKTKLQPVRPIIEETMELFSNDNDTRKLDIAFSAHADPVVSVDENLLRQLLLNLLVNAAQAMHNEGSIVIQLDKQADSCLIVVRDTGPGIPDDIRARIFEPFFTTKSKGTGLGLAIARRQVEQHGGTMQLVSPNDGGCQFEIRLPLGQ